MRFLAGGAAAPVLAPLIAPARLLGGPQQALPAAGATLNDLFLVRGIPDLPFSDPGHPNNHLGLDSLLYLMADNGLKPYRSSLPYQLCGPSGLIAPDDVVIIKVNAQWKYRGATNSDLVRGLIQRLLDHPDGFRGEVVIMENGQGRGSLACDTSSSYGGDTGVRANANDESHSFLHLVNTVFRDPRVSAILLDPVRATFIGADDHVKNGFRKYENVSYPCFTTAGGRRVELREGVWNGTSHGPGLKLINVPVLKHHDTGGSEFTASLKHFYGVVSMDDGQSGPRHYGSLGETAGKMAASVVTPVLNIIDAIWVSHASLTGWPASTTFRANQILAGQDPVALDAWAARNILYPIDGNVRHHPDFPGVNQWLVQARDTINARGGLFSQEKGILVDRVTRDESEMNVHACQAGQNIDAARVSLSDAIVSFLASSADSREFEKPLSITTIGLRPCAWRVEKDAGWLSVTPASGSGNGVVSVRVRAAGLDPGRYTGNLTVYCPEAVNSPQRARVSLTVIEPRREGPPARSRPKSAS
ncbi:MAG: hypothetical protein A2W03_07345 [Candidatus Aminicenantes bacterium RBG_16_63_16]|nr:MAG: hypothetical protein A2W03_07345 [Candidatus Aminicenantes bacterium RBG_16_63_16]